MSIKIRYMILDTRATAPTRATDGSGALDIEAIVPDDIMVLLPGETKLIGTGIAMHIESKSYAAFLLPRSGLGHNYGIVLGNLVGVIDSDYQGEVKVSLWNRSAKSFVVNTGDRIAQMLVLEIQSVTFEKCDSFDTTTDRGTGGFGHTGKQ